MLQKKIPTLLPLLFFVFLYPTFAQDKKPLDHQDYDHWHDLRSPMVSMEGNFVSYEINPQEGDGTLWLYETGTEEYYSFQRGYKAVFSPSEDFLAFRIKAEYDSIRAAKLDGVKKDKLPKDTLGIYLIGSDSLIKHPGLSSYKLPEEGSSWLAWLAEPDQKKQDSISSDTSASVEKPKKKKTKKKEKTLHVFEPGEAGQSAFENVEEYEFSKHGRLLSFLQTRSDSIDSVFIHTMIYPGIQSRVIFSGPGKAVKLAIDEQGMQVAWLYSADTGKLKVYEAKLFDIKSGKLITAVDTNSNGMPAGWGPSENGRLFFSENGRRLFFGTAPLPEPKAEDTLTEEEKVSVDIWNWKDDRLQPMQLKQKDKDLKRSYTAVYHIPKGTMVQLADEEVMNMSMDRKNNGKYAMGISRKPYYREMSWDADGYLDAYLVDLMSGERKLILKKSLSRPYLSPLGRYVAYYDALDSCWNTYHIKNGSYVKLTNDLDVSFSREDHDMPNIPGAYGMAGWTKDVSAFFVYDKYDIWKLDPEGRDQPIRLTRGREEEMQHRIIDLDKELEYIPEDEPLLLRSLDKQSKDFAFYNYILSEDEAPREVFSGPYRFYTPRKAKHADRLIWQRMNFREYPDLYTSTLDFSGIKRLSDANPQQDEYLWGSVELVHWTSADGEDLDGLLYKPGNFDPDSSYPMIVYFYETYSDALHAHYVPKPSRSTVNFTYYASNGYLVFVPDIVYKTGYPGRSAYNSVVSGTLKLMENPWVDREHIGIQGQSWGGYQVAFLVTRTNLFAAAMAGAPVSNMTSAYGGIRWGSGMSRMFQYEGSQSRIGGTLWEKPWRYIENSPVFYADKVETPLLMMHNDEDGAVPWYQGIEYFVALRRLDKPVWMLTYNGAPHNLKRRADCKDLSIRMQQFFDHYLKGAPAPVWMEYGIPAVDKGKKSGFELVEQD